MGVVYFLYDLFVLNAWVIPVICLMYGAVIRYLLRHNSGGWSYLIPVFCIAISAVVSLTIPDIDRAAHREQSSLLLLTDGSNIVYDGLAAVGIYELVKSTRKFVLIRAMKRKRKTKFK